VESARLSNMEFGLSADARIGGGGEADESNIGLISKLWPLECWYDCLCAGGEGVPAGA